MVRKADAAAGLFDGRPGGGGELPFHEVANLFPLLDGPDLAALKADIASHGLREPVWTYRGQIIDGRNRYRACREVGVEPRFREWDGEGSLVAFVVSLNLHRRHLSSSQKATVAVEIEPLLAEEAAKRQQEGQKKGGETAGRSRPRADSFPQKIAGSNDGEAREQAARLTGTNRSYVSQAKRLKEEAPDLFDEVKAGKLKVTQAASALRQRERLADLEAAPGAAVDNGAAGSWEVRTGDCLELLRGVEEGSVRLAFADPPYNEGVDYGGGEAADRRPEGEYLAWCEERLRATAGTLTPDGSLWVLISGEYVDHFGLMLRRIGLHRRGLITWYETFGVNCSGKFNRCSRFLLYCVKSPAHFVFNPDAVSRPSARQVVYNDGRAAPGGKLWDDVWIIPRLTGTSRKRVPGFPTQLPLELLRPIVGCASDPGDLVLDPFSGSATTGAAGVELGRRYLGLEWSDSFAERSRQRLAGVGQGGKQP